MSLFFNKGGLGVLQDTAGVPATYFGMHVFGPAGGAGVAQPFLPWPEVSFGAARLSGRISWRRVETARGVYDWSVIDPLISTFNYRGYGGQNLSYTIVEVPVWAGGGAGFSLPPSDYTYVTEFVTAVCQRYSTPGVSFKLGNIGSINEPNILGWSTADVFNMQQAVYNAVKAVNPLINVLSPETTNWSLGYGPTDMATYLSAGIGQYCDVMAFHGYNGTLSNVGTSIATTIADYKTAFATAGITKPICNTEGGWGAESQLTDLDAQAAFLAQQYLLQWGLGVTKYNWYAWDANNTGDVSPVPSGSFGVLWNTGDGLRKAGTAYTQVRKWMLGARVGLYTNVGNIWTVPITRPLSNYSALAIWDATGSTYSIPSQYIQYRDLDGVLHTNIGNTITLSNKPILLETGNF